MRLTLKQKSDSTARDPLLIMVEHPADLVKEKGDLKTHPKMILAVTVGQTIDCKTAFEPYKFSDADADILGAEIQSKYRGCFVYETREMKAPKKEISYETKA